MKKDNKFSFFTILKLLFLVTVVVVVLLPILHVVAVSLSSNAKIMNNEVTIFPKGITLEAYKYVLTDPKILIAYKNTIVYVAIGTLLSLLATSTGAYSLSKKRLIFQKGFMIGIIITMFFSGGMVPLFLTVKNLGLYDSMWAIILVPLVSSWNLIIMKSFFEGFPVEIEESGKMDGLNDIGIFVNLVLPVSKASLSSIGLFYAVGLWNSYFNPFLYLETPSKFPLQVVLQSILQSGTSLNASNMSGGDLTMIPESLKYATVMVAIIPIIAVYPFIQKYFVKGVMVGSVKG